MYVLVIIFHKSSFHTSPGPLANILLKDRLYISRMRCQHTGRCAYQSCVEAHAVVGVVDMISFVIMIVQEIKQVYDAANDATGLPEAFREVAKNLPLVDYTLRLVKDSVSDETWKVIHPIIEACKVKAGLLKKLFDEVVPKEGAKRRERYEKALRSLGKGCRVEHVMREILEDLHLVATGRVFANATELAELAAVIEAAIVELSEIQPSAPDSVFDSPTGTKIDQTDGGLNAASFFVPISQSHHEGALV
jgi:hypothetical protein